MPLSAGSATTCPISRSRHGRTPTASPCVKEEEKGAMLAKGNPEHQITAGSSVTLTTSGKDQARTKVSSRT